MKEENNMSCNNSGQGSITIDKKSEWNKLIKGLILEINRVIDLVNEEIKREKSHGVVVKNYNQLSGWRLKNIKLSTCSTYTYSYYSNRIIIDYIIKNRPKKLTGVTSFFKNQSFINILFGEFVTFDNDSQTIKIDVDENNHNLDDFQLLRMTRALCTLLSKVQWRKRGDRDGGYVQTRCEYSGMGFCMAYGRIGEDIINWFNNRP